MTRLLRRRLIRSRSKPADKGVRASVVAGIYYPAEPVDLRETVDRLLSGGGRNKKQKAVAAVAPHGSFRLAGAVLGALHASLEWPALVVVVGPNHSGRGAPLGISLRGAWSTPLGELKVHERMARLILKSSPDLQKDDRCHQDEHSIELQLPFFQRLGVRGFVPIAVGPCDAETARRVGEGIARAVRLIREPVLVLASTNLTTYRPAETVGRSDPAILERILALQEEALMEQAAQSQSGMCGVSALAVVIAAAKILGAARGRLVRYQSSAEMTGIQVSATGYAGVVLEG